MEFQISTSVLTWLDGKFCKSLFTDDCVLFSALAKHTDGDFTKFVDELNKPRDNAQRWRAYKNISRFYKNPFGYTYWKTDVFHRQNRFRIFYFLVGFHLLSSYMLYVMVKNRKERMIEHWRYRIGEVNKFHSMGHRDRRMPVNRIKNYVRYSNFHQVRRNKRLGMMHLNWWCRDQNFRKYFEMRKKNGIAPSETGFYHEPIAAETRARNIEIYNMIKSGKAQ